jgi:hypothetical protein
VKEQITIRLYENPHVHQPVVGDRYLPADQTYGWHYQPGDQIGLLESFGGFLMAGIESIDQKIFEDNTGRYKLAVVWTLD